MLFSSLSFLFVFLPAVLLVYYLAPKKAKNIVLLLFSFVFYAWGELIYTLLLFFSILANYIFATKIKKSNNSLPWLKVGLIFNISIILFFKYLDFFIVNINQFIQLVSFDLKIPIQNISLPLGISFFTFQQMSLLWDVYRQPKENELNLLNTSLYISFFPQLIAGPIVRYKDIINQVRSRYHEIKLFRSGVERFILGLFKKIIIANTCGELADEIMANSAQEINTPIAWLGITAYTIQIYFDFSGYSDMAIGLGRMFGFRIMENFNFPYLSKSIKEFWRRWHISLSTWFRDYVYIPLGGNRKGKYRVFFNLFTVFLLTGFWHGASWSFVFWGVFHGIFLIVERIGFGKVLDKAPSALSWLYTLLTVMVGWVFFRIENINEAFVFVGKLFSFSTESQLNWAQYLTIERIAVLSLAALASSTFFQKINESINAINTHGLLTIFSTVRDLVYLSMFFIAVVYINSGSYNPFIYFRF